MTVSATVRVMSAEEIVARAGGETPFLYWPVRSTVFAEREMRFRQLARGHSMADYLEFMACLCKVQHHALNAFPDVPIPDHHAVELAARSGLPLIPAHSWVRSPEWQHVARLFAGELLSVAPAGARESLLTIIDADAEELEKQANWLLRNQLELADLGAAPVLGGALQVYWTHMLLATQERHQSGGQPFGRIDNETVCPCCGSLPTASITRSSGESLGQRYLHCALCNLQWHMVRIKCPSCLSSKSLAYQSLTLQSEEDDSQAATARVQAETCEECGSYLKIMHSDRDPFIEPLADDVASLTLDLLVQEAGNTRHGFNFMLLIGGGRLTLPSESQEL